MAALSGSLNVQPSAVLIPLYIDGGQISVILTQRGKGTRFSGDIVFPGGRPEKKEEMEQVALREAWEEVGLKPYQDVSVFERRKAYFTRQDNSIIPVVGILRNKEALSHLRCDGHEVADVFMVPLKDLFRATENFTKGGKDQSGILSQFERNGVLHYRFSFPHPERKQETVRLETVTAAILYDFLEEHGSERQLFHNILAHSKENRYDRPGKWLDRVIENYQGGKDNPHIKG
jgi:8-oxo-dGTP pyrophosphatase MutT (NUDIX family)